MDHPTNEGYFFRTIFWKLIQSSALLILHLETLHPSALIWPIDARLSEFLLPLLRIRLQCDSVIYLRIIRLYRSTNPEENRILVVL